MKRLILALAFLVFCPSAWGMQRAFSYCEEGGFNAHTQGLASTDFFQRSFKSCTVTVYLAGIVNINITAISRSGGIVTATLASNFPSYGVGATAVVSGVTDVTFNGSFTVTGTPAANQVTWTQAGADAASASGSASFLAKLYNDNLSPPTILANPFTAASDGFWFFYAVAGKYDVRFSNSDIPLTFTRGDYLLCDPIGPNADSNCQPAVACTSVQVSGVEAGCEHEINFIPGTNITSITAVDNPGNGRNDVTINASGGGAAIACDPAKTVNLYIDPTGSDVTGDGTFANPWETVQKAWDTGVPGVVDGRYFINLKSPGTYVGPFVLKDRVFFGGGYDLTSCSSMPKTPCSMVTVIGDPMATSTYILSCTAADSICGGQALGEVSAASVRFSGVTFTKGGYGLIASNGAIVTLEAIKFLNNYTGLLIMHSSRVLVMPDQYVDFDFATLIVDAAGTIGGIPFHPNIGIFGIGLDSKITDVCEDQKTYSGSWLYILDTNATGYGIDGFLMQAAEAFLTRLNVTGGDVFSEGADMKILYIDVTDPSTNVAINAVAGRISGGLWDGGPGQYNVTNAVYAYGAQTGGQVDTYGTLVNVTYPVVATSNPIPDTMIGDFAHVPEQGRFQTAVVTGSGPWSTVFNMRYGSIIKLTLANDVTISTSNSSYGDRFTAIICQDGAGAHLITWADTMIGAETIGSTASKCNMQSFVRSSDVAVTWYATGPMIKNQ